MMNRSENTNTTGLGVVFAALIVLLLATMVAGELLSGTAGLITSLTISVAKTLLIVLVFMKLRRSPTTTRLAAGAGVVWLTLATLGVLADYLTRGDGEVPRGGLRETQVLSAYDRINP